NVVLVLPARQLVVRQRYVNSVLSQSADSGAPQCRIEDADDDASDARLDDRLRGRRRPFPLAGGLKRDVERSAAGEVPRLGQSLHLGLRPASPRRRRAGDELLAGLVDDERPHRWVRPGGPAIGTCQPRGCVEPAAVDSRRFAQSSSPAGASLSPSRSSARKERKSSAAEKFL